MITKGEWKIRRGQRPHANTKDFIAIVGDTRVAAIIGEKWDDAEANAQLIAAAPDLYEALKDILTHVIQEDKEFELIEALKALAKAEGKK